jgi:threonine dehydratase
MAFEPPSIATIRDLRARLGTAVYRTPLLDCAGLDDLVDQETRIFGKLEFLQHTGTFKVRGALAVLATLDAGQLGAGVTAVSAGNHAIATAYAAAAVGTSAKVVMFRGSNPARVEACRKLGADIVIADDVHQAFQMAAEIEQREGRFLVHPFEGPQVATGTGTVGLEICEQCEEFDAVVVPVGGGGLIGGIANAIKQLRPDARVIGVEPTGADTLRRSLAAGKPRDIPAVRTIADSLGAPFALPYSFELCRRNVDQVVLVDDDELRNAMGLLFNVMKFAVEPACAATTAALLGPLRAELAGLSVVLVFCGSNIDWRTFASHVQFQGSRCLSTISRRSWAPAAGPSMRLNSSRT